MAKKTGVAKKKTITKISKKRKTPTKSKRDVNVEKKLVENFVSLQKVMTNLGVKFDKLSGEISKLLELFEISAKTLAKKDFELGKNNKSSKEVVEKLDNLLEQNKVIARGLSLLHEPVERSPYPAAIPREVPTPRLQPPMRVQRRPKVQQTPVQPSVQAPVQSPVQAQQAPQVQKHSQEAAAPNLGEGYEKSQSIGEPPGASRPPPNFKKLPQNPADKNQGV